ncbi:hypothetical protein JCM10213_008700 [Rhodosporidiobolus nylandii]
MPPSALLLHALSSTALLLLFPVPLLLWRPLARAARGSVFLPLSSLLCASLSGLLGLIALGSASRGAAVVGGVCGALAVCLLDAHVLARLWRERPVEGEKKRRVVLAVLAGAFVGLLLAATALHVSLLCLLAPAHSTLLGVAIARAVLHIAFTGCTLAALVTMLPVRNREKSGTEARLIALQALAVLLDILSVAFPLHPNYALFADGRRAAPTLLGTTLSPSGHAVTALFAAVRWAGALAEVASPSTALSAPSKSSLAAQYHRSTTPSPSTAPLAAERGDSLSAYRSESPLSARLPSTSMSRMLHPDIAAHPLPRSPSPWSTSALAHGDTGAPLFSSTSPSPTPTLSASSGKTKPRTRNLSINSLLSRSFSPLGRSRASTVNQSSEGGVEVQTIELQHPYYHTETVPITYEDSGDGSGEMEDVVVREVAAPEPVSAPSTPKAASPVSHRASKSLPPLFTQQQPEPVTPPPSSPPGSSSAASSPVIAKRSSSSLSFSPLLFHKFSQSGGGGGGDSGTESSSPIREFTPSPFPLESPPSSPERTRIRRPSTSASNTLSRTPSQTIRAGGAHASTASAATAYYSLPRSPPVAGSYSPKKLRRPSLGTLPSLGGNTSSSGGGGDSPTRTRRRSGSVGSVLRALKRESATPSLATGESVGASMDWEVEPNEAEDDPFAPAPLGAGEEGKRQEERVREWQREARRRSSLGALSGGVSLEVSTVHERSDEGASEGISVRAPTGIDVNETGSVIDYGESAEEDDNAVERVLTPVPSTAGLDGDDEDDGHFSSSERGRRASSSITPRARRGSDSSASIFIEHLKDEDLDSPLSPAAVSRFAASSPSVLTHSLSAGSLGQAFRLGSNDRGSAALSPPPLSHAGSFATAPSTPPRASSAQEAGTSPYAAAGQRFARGLDGAAADTPQLSSPIQGSPLENPRVAPSPPRVEPRPPSPLRVFRRAHSPVSARPSIFPFTATSDASSPAAPLEPRRGSTSGSGSFLFAGASFTLRKMRLRSPSLPVSPRPPSSSSDLSFACRGPEGSPGDLRGPLSPQEAITSPATRLDEAPQDGVEKVESFEVAFERAPNRRKERNPAPTAAVTAGGPAAGRKAWWKGQLPGGRPSTHYRRSDTSSGRLTRSASTSASIPSFLRASVSGESSASSRRARPSSLQPRSHTPVLRLSAYQLDEPASVSPIGSFRPHSGPPQLARRNSAATSKRSYFSARTGGSRDGQTGAGAITEENLAELDDLVRAFSPSRAAQQDLEWPSYPPGGSLDGREEQSFEFPEQAFDADGEEDDLDSSSESGRRSSSDAPFYHPRQRQSLLSKHKRHFSAPLPTSPTTTADEGAGDTSFGLSIDAERSPLSPAFSFGSMGGARRRSGEGDLASPITPASFGFAAWSAREEVKLGRTEGSA